MGVIFQANSLLFYWLSKSRGPRFLSRNTAHSRFLSLVSCDQKQISNMLDLKTQSLAIKIVSLKLPHTADFLDLRQKSPVATTKICCVRLALIYGTIFKGRVQGRKFRGCVCVCVTPSTDNLEQFARQFHPFAGQ